MANYESKFTGADLDRSISIAKDSVADAFSTSTSYAVGDLVIYDDATDGSDLYKCIVAHQGAWVASDFSKIKLSEAISQAGKVTGVKGNAETDYRIGDVNLTAANIGAQETLVSGTNIKTINSTSVLGSGDIAITAGGECVVIDTTEWATHTITQAHLDTLQASEKNYIKFYNYYNGTPFFRGMDDGVVYDGMLVYSNVMADDSAEAEGAAIYSFVIDPDTRQITEHSNYLQEYIGDIEATATELNYVHGVTSAIQTQINGKQSTLGVNPSTTTSTLTGLTINGTSYGIQGEPAAYIKSAAVSDTTLTLTKKDDSTVVYDPQLVEGEIDLTLTSTSISDGTTTFEVSANPATTTSTLTGLKVGGTNYAVTSGGEAVLIAATELVSGITQAHLTTLQASEKNYIILDGKWGNAPFFRSMEDEDYFADLLVYSSAFANNTDDDASAYIYTYVINPSDRSITEHYNALQDYIGKVDATAADINKLAGLTTTKTELGYVHGVTSAIQTQINNKVTKNADITAGTHTKITYDAKGLVTAGADLTASDIPDLNASKITDGTFADARIASAATWNAKQDAITSSTALTVKTLTGGLTYVTTAPTAANTDGIKIAVLSEEPATKYDGWLYLITSA